MQPIEDELVQVMTVPTVAALQSPKYSCQARKNVQEDTCQKLTSPALTHVSTEAPSSPLHLPQTSLAEISKAQQDEQPLNSPSLSSSSTVSWDDDLWGVHHDEQNVEEQDVYEKLYETVLFGLGEPPRVQQPNIMLVWPESPEEEEAGWDDELVKAPTALVEQAEDELMHTFHDPLMPGDIYDDIPDDWDKIAEEPDSGDWKMKDKEDLHKILQKQESRSSDADSEPVKACPEKRPAVEKSSGDEVGEKKKFRRSRPPTPHRR
eukprot:TRINITY_DN8790_c0_g1_i1.p1 TRINITY_DN8790_c0_g1~~TRINITY_DN8790_c0_g1_i1.p1  ORF type:complete len:263 (-),score=77.96 TRINITY_DN8790_c0_g1_i1:226-1014(-)